MSEPSISNSASLLRPFVNNVIGRTRRFHAERQAGQGALVQSSSLVDDLLSETLARLRGRSINSGWWRSLLDRFGQQFIAPDFLTKPALQDWLADESVASDLKTITTWRILATDEDEAGIFDRLSQSYSNHTGEAAYLATGPIDVVVAILVAGYFASIPSEQYGLAGIVQAGISRADERLHRIEQSLSSRTDPLTRKAHTDHAAKELARALALRVFDPEGSRSKIRELQEHIENGDLIAADAGIKLDIQYWLARLSAGETETLDVAREARTQIVKNDPSRNLSVVDALIAETGGDPQRAIRILRDHDNPDSRSALFGVLARTHGTGAALDMYADTIEGVDARFFTAVGWRNWACSMAEIGRWQEAAQRLAGLDETWSDLPALAIIEGIINAQMLLPTDRRSLTLSPQLFVGMTPNQGADATAAHERASFCIEIAQTGLEHIEETDFVPSLAEWRRWLRLMDPRADNALVAQIEVRQGLERDTPDVNLMPFAWVFGVSFDPVPLRRYLAGRKRLGGLDEDELRAECLLLLNSVYSGETSCREFLDYLDTTDARLVRVVPEDFLRAMRIDALVRDGQTERARSLLTETGGDLGDAEAIRLSAMIDAHEGLDPRADLERAYSKTGHTFDLRNLVNCLKQVNDRAALLPLLEKLVERQPTVPNVTDLVACLSGQPFFNYRRIVEVLDSHSDLVEQSRDLKIAKASALLQISHLSEAKEATEQLLDGSQMADAIGLDIHVALASGDWERLPAIVEREWERRNDHAPGTLMTLAQVAGHQDRSPGRALKLAKLAAERAPDDPHVLAAAYWLHFHLGRDSEADPSWLSRAFEHSSAEDGPLWSTDYRTVVTKWMPEQQERLAETEAKWLDGEIPAGIAASLFNVPLTHLLVQIPESNAGRVDRRKSPAIPVVFGGRPPVEVKADAAVGLDITTILVLHYLDLLESVLAAFQQIKLAPDVMEFLFQERAKVRFHQPSRVRDAQQFRNLCNRGWLRVADNLEPPPSATSEEVGRDLGALLQAARNDDGRVVCVHPIHRPDSLMEMEADTTQWNDLIVSVPDFCRLLHRRGTIDGETHGRAQLFLQRQGQEECASLEPAVLNRPIYLDALTLTYLQNARALESIAAAGYDIRIHPRVLSRMDEFITAGDAGEELATKIDAIRHALRNAVDMGRATYLPRKVDPDSLDMNRNPQIAITQSLLAAAAECDALCIDDRAINRNVRHALSENPASVMPIACVLDLLRCLHHNADLTSEDHWAARHKLREGGFVSVPFEAEELAHWLRIAMEEDGKLSEGPELRAIRQSTVRTTNLGLANPAEVPLLLANLLQASVSALRSLWNDDSISVDFTVLVSDWIWYHLVVAAIGDRRHAQEDDYTDVIQVSMSQRVSLVLMPPLIDSSDRRNDYRDWLESSVLRPIRYANADLIEGALRTICDLTSDHSSESVAFGQMFIEQLPKSARQYLLSNYPDRARRWGLERATTFDLSADVSIVDDALFTAAKEVLSAHEGRSLQSMSGDEVAVSFDPEDHTIVLECGEADSHIKTKLSDLSLLSPSPEVRVGMFRTMLDRFGPAASDFSNLLSALELRLPSHEELSKVFHETVHGVAAVQGAMLRKTHFGQPIGPSDVLPADVDYFAKLVGPLSEFTDQESYIRNVLIPYRRALLDRDLNRGLDICCVGALRDDLCPGQWMLHLDDEAVWEALSKCDTHGTPFSLLAALDVALYRQRDERFREFAEKAVITLCDDEFGQQHAVDVYRLVWTFAQLALNRINLIENVSKQPGFWKRMCAWMQAQVVARALIRAPVSIAMDRLDEWSQSNLTLGGVYAELVGFREEPMLLYTGRLSASDFRCEVIGCLVALRSRHESEGRLIPHAEEIERALERVRERGELHKCFLPGPLEGRRETIATIPDDLANALAESRLDIADSYSWSIAFFSSHVYVFGEAELAHVREAVRKVAKVVDDDDRQSLLHSLEIASVVARTNRDTTLAEAVADGIVSAARKMTDETDVRMILPICLQSAAAFEDRGAWFNWLEETLGRIAGSLPGFPNRSLQVFLKHLDAMETILPVYSWFHRRAKSIASVGTDLRP